MEEAAENSMDLFSQSGVLLTNAPASYINFLNTSGTLYITEYLNSHGLRYIEWRPSDVTIDSDIQDQEWAVVNTIEGRSRHLSETQQSDVPSTRARQIRINMKDIKSFRISRNHQKLYFNDGSCEILIAFFFQHGNADSLVCALKSLVRTMTAKRDKNLFIIVDECPDHQILNRSFAELDLFTETSGDYVWKFVRNLHNRPYETTMEAFAKLGDIVYRGTEQRDMSEDVTDLLNQSLTTIENNTTTHTHDEYEVIAHVPKLPFRREFPRGRPLSVEQWEGLQDPEGRIEDVEAVKLVIFRGGVVPMLRSKVWKFLLGYFPWDSTRTQRDAIKKQKNEEYFVMKLQWRSLSKVQENNFTDYRDRKSLVEKDVNRTDRTVPFYAGDNNPNISLLSDILMTYVMYNFNLGYVQGMSDLLSPILFVFQHEVDSFWSFVGFMDKVCTNFDMDQAGMKEQLEQLHKLLSFAEPELASYLDRHESGNMFFCFRWLLVWFKREFTQEDIMYLWEVMWTGLPCKNFHLLMCVAILETEKSTLMDKNYGFTEILKHVNDLSQNINLQAMISKAEGIYHQIVEAPHLTDSVRVIIGLQPVGSPNDIDVSASDDGGIDVLNSTLTNDTISSSNNSNCHTDSPDRERDFDRSIDLTYI